MLLRLAGPETDEGVNLPDDPGSAIVWVLFLAVLVGLYLLIRRTRDRAERERQERLERREQDGE